MEIDLCFTSDIVRQRNKRLQTALADAPFDVLVLTTPESILYVSGFRSVSASVFGDYLMAVIVSPAQMILVIGAGEAAAALDGGIDPDQIVSYGTFYFEGDIPAGLRPAQADFSAAVSAAVSRVSQSNPVVALESPARTASVASGVAHAVDATEWLSVLRAVKLPAEQQCLRTAVSIAEDGIRAGIGAITAGATERDVARVVAATMASRGGTPRFVVVTAGERSALSDAFASERTIAPGDLVRFDIGCVYEGYWSDIARTAVLGPPSRRQASFYAALRAGVDAEIDIVQPGITAGELFETAVGRVRTAGIPTYRRHHVGHAIGLSVYERPVIAAHAPTELQPGMVLCLETPYYELGWGGMMLEDTGVVTEDGFELFTTLDRGLAVVSP